MAIILKIYKPLANHVFRVLNDSASETEKINARLAEYLRRAAVEATAEILPEEIDALEEKIDEIERKVKWLARLVKASGVNDLEKRFQIIHTIQNQLEAVRQTKKTAENMPEPERSEVLKRLDQAEKRLIRLEKKSLEILNRLAKGHLPKAIKNLGDRIKAFFQRRLPRKGVKIEVKYSVIPIRPMSAGKPILVFGYHLIFRNVPKFSDPKGKTTVHAGIFLQAKMDDQGEAVYVNGIVVSRNFELPTHGKNLILMETKSWKEAVTRLVREAAKLDAVLLANPLKLKPKKRAFTRLGFPMKGIDIKIKRNNTVQVIYKIGTHRELKGVLTRNLNNYNGHDVLVIRESRESPIKYKTSTELDKLILQGTAEALGVRPINLKLIKKEVNPDRKEVVYEFNFVAIPEAKEIK